jgi:hypothetical protein
MKPVVSIVPWALTGLVSLVATLALLSLAGFVTGALFPDLFDPLGAIIFPFVSLFSCPLLSIILCIISCGFLYILIRKRVKMRKRLVFFMQVISFVFTIFVSSWVHGDSGVASRFYEVPVEVTFNPSDGAFDNIYFKGALSVEWYWSDKGGDCDDFLEYPLNYGTQGLMKGSSARVPYREPYTTTLKVLYAKRYIGYLDFHLPIGKEHIDIHQRGGSLTIPIRKGEREFNLVDGKGFSWRIKTKTLDEKARFVKVRHQLWP